MRMHCEAAMLTATLTRPGKITAADITLTHRSRCCSCVGR